MESILNTAQNRPSIVLPTAYCAPIEYFGIIAQKEDSNFIIEKMETYPKQTWRNRCTILTSQGLLNLSIPVQKPQGNHTPTDQITIQSESRWNFNHWKAITSAYNASPFFLYYKDELEPFYTESHNNLLDFNTLMTHKILSILKIQVTLKYTENYIDAVHGFDFRSALSPKKESYFTHYPSYTQVFSDKINFHQNLSILDLLFNLGPEAGDYLKQIR